MVNPLARSFRRMAAILTGAALGCAPQVAANQGARGADGPQQVSRQLPMIHDAATINYVNEVGQRLARIAGPPGSTYRFFVVDSDQANSFALPGGFIYINRGLIERTGSLSEFAAVLAHEIAHQTQRHGFDELRRVQNADLLPPLLYAVLLGRRHSEHDGSALFAGHSREAEHAADRAATGYLVRAGYTPSGLATFFEEVLSLQRREPSSVEQWFRTHPTSAERVARTRAAIAQTSGAQDGRLAADARAFQDFRMRLKSLPMAQDRRR